VVVCVCVCICLCKYTCGVVRGYVYMYGVCGCIYGMM